METNIVGFRFCPTDEELINYFLKNKIQGKPCSVDDTIREVNICSYEPASLPALSMIKSKDSVWYFISPKVYTSTKKNVTKRTTPSGFWKSTGKDRNVRKDKRRNGVVIGTKKTLVYHEGTSSSAVRTPWTMHEYNIASLPPVDQGGQAGEESLYGFSVNDVTMITGKQENPCPWDTLCPIPNTLIIDNNNNNPNVHLQAPCLAQDDDEFLSGLTHVHRKHVEFLFIYDQEFTTQENYEYMLKWLC